MKLELVNQKPKWPRATLIDPPNLGYIHLSADVEAPTGRAPRPGKSSAKTALLDRLRSQAAELERADAVEKATVYRAILSPPLTGYAREKATRPARFDVVVLIETTSVDAFGDVKAAEPYQRLHRELTTAARDLHVMDARCVKRIGDVDKTRQGLFLFNYFVAEDTEVASELWDYLAGWFMVETGLDNSTLLLPLGDADYVFVNHARWNYGLGRLFLHQIAKPSFRSYVLANLSANRTGSMPSLYRLA